MHVAVASSSNACSCDYMWLQTTAAAASSSSTAELLVGPMERDLAGINSPVALRAKVRDAA